MFASRLRVLLTAAIVAAAVVEISAHRRDEYLQAARVAVDERRVDVELDLTPGIAVAAAVTAEIDRNGDSRLSPEEQHDYVRRVLNDAALHVDGRAVRLQAVESSFPDPAAFDRGEGTIRIHAAADLPRLASGSHQVLFRNAHRRDLGVYLANALVPQTSAVAIGAQRRDPDQRELTIDYSLTASDAPSSSRLWLFALCGAAVAVAFVLRPSAPRQL